MRDDERDKHHERERQWNKPNGRSPPQSRIPESVRRFSQGSPSHNTTIRPDAPSPSRNLSRRASATSMRNIGDGRSSMGSSLSSQADCTKSFSSTRLRLRLIDCCMQTANEWRIWRTICPGSESGRGTNHSPGAFPPRPSTRPTNAPGRAARLIAPAVVLAAGLLQGSPSQDRGQTPPPRPLAV